jgi:UDP-N-acetylglucosamine--N-acetylmuramyl-(pentapeptide) pyrophosphoryl-undecaprenol N-acetylglucosamine transferase
MDLAYAASDIVLCRAGISTITELANLGKIGIIIPMPNTHQEENAVYLGMQKAAIIGSQNFITPEIKSPKVL